MIFWFEFVFFKFNKNQKSINVVFRWVKWFTVIFFKDESDCLEDHHNVTDEVVDGLDGIIENSQWS